MFLNLGLDKVQAEHMLSEIHMINLHPEPIVLVKWDYQTVYNEKYI